MVSTVWTDPRYEEFVKLHGADLGWASRKLWVAFQDEFGVISAPNFNAFRLFAARIRDGGTVVVPRSTQRVVTDEVLQIGAKGALITADHQVPYHDAEWMEFAFEMGSAFGCDTHILNGDVFDMSVFSRFEPQLSEGGSTFEDELGVVEAILAESAKRFKETVMLYGNHEWRLLRRVLQSKLSAERFSRLFSTDDSPVTLTELSYVVVNGTTRVTHPRAYSRIAARVGVQLAAKHHQNVVVAHDHQVGYARDVSGKFTVVHSGCMADPNRMDYPNTADSTAPMMSRGFVILTPGGELILFDYNNCDRDFWRRLVCEGAA